MGEMCYACLTVLSSTLITQALKLLKQENQKPRVIFGYILCSKHSKYTFPNGDWELRKKIIVGKG